MDRRADVQHDLLFGLLALQNGMVDQAQLVAAFGEWTVAKDRPMAEILVAQGVLSQARRVLLEALVAEHVSIHGGDPEKSLAALAADRSTARVAGAVRRSGDRGQPCSRRIARSTDFGLAEETASYSVGTATSDGKRFRILRPHAQGGLGAVFVALDAELHREVALKQILDRHADDHSSRQRFVQEAEITGGLEHPGDRAGVWAGLLRRRPALLCHAVHQGRLAEGGFKSAHRPQDAEAAYRTAIGILEPLDAGLDAGDLGRMPLADTLDNLGNLYSDEQRYADAERVRRRAMDIRRAMVHAHPRDLGVRSAMATGLGNLGDTLSRFGKYAEAEALVLEAMVLREAIIAEHPDRPDQRISLAKTLSSLAILCRESGRHEEAIAFRNL